MTGQEIVRTSFNSTLDSSTALFSYVLLEAFFRLVLGLSSFRGAAITGVENLLFFFVIIHLAFMFFILCVGNVKKARCASGAERIFEVNIAVKEFLDCL